MIEESPDVSIQTVAFADNGVEITYSEKREQSDTVALYRTIAIDIEHVSVEIEEALESLRDAVDKGLLALRKPAKKIRRRLLDEEPDE